MCSYCRNQNMDKSQDTRKTGKRAIIICIVIAIAVFTAVMIKRDMEGRKLDAEHAAVADEIAKNIVGNTYVYTESDDDGFSNSYSANNLNPYMTYWETTKTQALTFQKDGKIDGYSSWEMSVIAWPSGTSKPEGSSDARDFSSSYRDIRINRKGTCYITIDGREYEMYVDSSNVPSYIKNYPNEGDYLEINPYFDKYEDASDEDSSDDSDPVSISTGKSNVFDRAKSYLQSSNFSYQGLIDQLVYEGYTESEAKAAVDNCGADWNEQALGKAKSYLRTSAFSYSGLKEQLEYEDFTDAQAQYGVDNCGADWNEQAVKKAKSYMNLKNYSRSELIEQLEFEGFTSSQAQYGVNHSM